MSTWEEYKAHVKEADPEMGKEISEIEEQVKIISAIIQQRQKLGLSQRDLAMMCSVPQSSIARIEAHKVTPKLDMIIKIFNKLGLQLTVN